MPQPTDPRMSRPFLHELWHVTHASLAEAGALAFPVVCVGCGDPPRMLCERCLREVRPAPSLRELDTGLRVWSGLPFSGVPAQAIRALKADLRTPLARALAPALACALDAAWAETRPDCGTRPLLVPIPTSIASWRRRGVRVVELLLRRAGALPCRVLRPARRVADQRGLDRAGRGNNVAHSMRSAHLQGIGVVLIDDVVTTGATLAEASRAVTAAGGVVLGAVTLASTPLIFGGSQGDA